MIPEEVEEAVLLDLDDDEEGDSTLMWGADVEDSVLKEQEMLLLGNPSGVLPQTIPQILSRQKHQNQNVNPD